MGTLIIASGLVAATSSILTPPSEEAIKTGPLNVEWLILICLSKCHCNINLYQIPLHIRSTRKLSKWLTENALSFMKAR